jgi:hypothetical protein
MRRYRTIVLTAFAGALAAPSAQAAFHFMQIEQVIGGVEGDTTQQAIQLRMRFGGQNVVGQSRLRVFDATGANPVLVVDMTTNLTNGNAGDRVLIATTNFAAAQNVTPDFLIANPIPPSYLAAGSLRFEHDGSTVYWSLSWGGAGYTGSTLGDATNDADGNFGPPFPGPLPSSSYEALRFGGAAGAPSTTNLADYALTSGYPTFTSNARVAVEVGVVFGDGFESP